MRLVLLLVLLACACGVATRQPPAPITPFASTPAAGFDVLITDRDRDLTVHRGQKIEVALTERPGMTPWNQITADNAAVLESIPTGITAPRGVTVAGFLALAAGSANISASATPLCSPGQACPQYAVLFEVRVTVT